MSEFKFTDSLVETKQDNNNNKNKNSKFKLIIIIMTSIIVGLIVYFVSDALFGKKG